jgi:murein DD-endopeptidase MepM/ murein hydrolase activator NlpD
MFDVTANTILWANDLTRASLINPGDTLIILPVAGVRHVVKRGDTIATIAKKYEGNAEEIIAYNQLDSATDITPGDTLVIPGGEIKVVPVIKKATLVKPTKSSVSTNSAAAGNGSLVNPAPGTIKTQGIHGYNGVDLGGHIGTTVRAAAAGTVIVAKATGWNGGYGNYIVIKHANGTQTLYGHLSKVDVSVGEKVTQAETIGALGNSGKSTGPHLHFEVRGGKNPF